MNETFDASLPGLMESSTTWLLVAELVNQTPDISLREQLHVENIIDEIRVAIIFLHQLLSSALGSSNEKSPVESRLRILAPGKMSSQKEARKVLTLSERSIAPSFFKAERRNPVTGRFNFSTMLCGGRETHCAAKTFIARLKMLLYIQT